MTSHPGEIVYACDNCGQDFRWFVQREFCPRCDDTTELTDDSGKRGDAGEKDRYTAYYGTDWQDARARVLERDDHQCRGCGLTDDEHRRQDGLFGDGLHIHHVQPARDFDSYDEANELSNLVALCADCHRQAENGDRTIEP